MLSKLQPEVKLAVAHYKEQKSKQDFITATQKRLETAFHLKTRKWNITGVAYMLQSASEFVTDASDQTVTNSMQ